MKFLSHLLILAFLSGQVQYAYTSLFCTHLQKPVGTPSLQVNRTEGNADPDMCEECQGVLPVRHKQVIEPKGCIEVRSGAKKVVDEFTDWNAPLVPCSSPCYLQPTDASLQLTLLQGNSLVLGEELPPLELPPSNLVLRI